MLVGFISPATIFVFLIPFGLGYGGTFVLIQLLTVESFGLKDIGKILGAITIFDEYTFADVPESVSEQVIKKAHMRKIGSTVVRIERASEKRGEEN